MRRKYYLLLVGLVMSLLSGLAGAESVAIAFSRAEGEVWGWARRDTQKEANMTALEFCNKNAQKRDCFLNSIKALVRAEGPGRVSYAWSDKSIADAKKKAVAGCKHSDCKVIKVMSEPGFVALSKSELDEEGNAVYHAAYAFRVSDEADKTAHSKCEAESGRSCKIVFSASIDGKLGGELVAKANHVERSCRPNTPTIRCTSNCVNGNCVVTYENGCKMRVQVAPRFDSFQNNWVYPSPSC